MRRRDHTGFVALCLSLTVHGALILGGIRYGWGGATVRVATLERRGPEHVTYKELEGLLDDKAALAMPIARHVEAKPEEPKPAVEEKSRVVPVVRPVEPVFVPNEIGRRDGKGTAIADADGKEKLQAREGGQDQPLLRRNPGMGTYVPAAPAPPGPVAKRVDGGGSPAAPAPAARPQQPSQTVAPKAGVKVAEQPKEPVKEARPAQEALRTGAKDEGEPKKAVKGEKVPERENMVKGGPKEVVNPPPGKVAVGKLERETQEKREAVAPKLPPPAVKAPEGISEFTLAPRPGATTGPTDVKAPPNRVAVTEVKPQPEKRPAVSYALAEVKEAGSEGTAKEDVKAPPRGVPRASDDVAIAEADLASEPAAGDRPAATPAAAPPPLTGGDPAPKAETESDAFTKVGAVAFRGNRVEAKFGRKVIVRQRPEIDPLNEMDVFTAARTVQLRVDIDETGKVIRVDVLKSSRYPQTIDLPCVKAIYTWWIEPPKGKDGKPTGDSMLWTITIR